MSTTLQAISMTGGRTALHLFFMFVNTLRHALTPLLYTSKRKTFFYLIRNFLTVVINQVKNSSENTPKT